MWVRSIGLLFCSVLLASSVASAADGNKVLFSPWSAAPTCTSGRACIYMSASDGQLYVIDGNAVTTKLHGAKSFRTSANCAGLSGPVNGDVWPEWVGAGWMAAQAGYPHMTVPMGDVHGIPVGVSFIGSAGDDAAIIAYGYAYEQASQLRPDPHYLASAEERLEISTAMTK